MRGRTLNAISLVFGAVLVLVALNALSHHEYTYFDALRREWISRFFELLVGAWFLFYGYIGLLHKGNLPMILPISTLSGRAVVLLVLFVPALLVLYFLHADIWLIVFFPIGIITTMLLLAGIFAAILPRKKRIVTTAQFADELERHLLGTEDTWDWDDITSHTIADERLERIRWELPKFDSLTLERDRDELKAIIAALRRGDLPEAVRPTHLTYQ